MRTLFVSILSLSALTSVALAEESVVLTEAQMDTVTASGTVVRGGRGGDAVAVSAAVIFVRGNVDDSTLTATSDVATATGGAGGAATFTPAP